MPVGTPRTVDMVVDVSIKSVGSTSVVVMRASKNMLVVTQICRPINTALKFLPLKTIWQLASAAGLDATIWDGSLTTANAAIWIPSRRPKKHTKPKKKAKDAIVVRPGYMVVSPCHKALHVTTNAKLRTLADTNTLAQYQTCCLMVMTILSLELSEEKKHCTK
mmetsp:Transcript_7552/g.18244  ORF Transcript_7552/g.18244 Transcript_7552/m.18244 type:complete len:163 (-) Transcript_7552:214-702(-)